MLEGGESECKLVPKKMALLVYMYMCKRLHGGVSSNIELHGCWCLPCVMFINASHHGVLVKTPFSTRQQIETNS